MFFRKFRNFMGYRQPRSVVTFLEGDFGILADEILKGTCHVVTLFLVPTISSFVKPSQKLLIRDAQRI
ncbi:hypothetical protein T10_7208 [Trichinella papuae]|uniref:Uncharacterized protein n=1 Tax=Trichinella papuae TaxID=268474 RepID=A0A0V1M7Q2_9BILA|nr:hypothetical protein T10_7208 [Trichinella papuae]